MSSITARYGRCIEGWQRTQAAIVFRLSQLAATARTSEEIDNDLDLLLLLNDRRDWENLIRQTPMLAEQGA